MKRMNKLITQRKSVSIVCSVLLVFAVAACDTTNVASDQDVSGNLDIPAAALIEGLDLSNSEAQQVAEIMSKYDTQEPGRLWYVASELQETLTEDQKESLISSVNNEEVRQRTTRTRTRGQRGQLQRGGLDELENPLTEEQKEELKALREEQRTGMKALIKERRADTLSEEAFKAQMEEAREQMRAELENILTEEQLSEWQARRDEVQENRGTRGNRTKGTRVRGQRGARGGDGELREEFQAAMIDALELTPEQQEQLKVVREELRSEMEELRGQFDRDNPEEAREAMKSLSESAKEQSNEVFTEAQRETIAIHRALMHEVRSSVKKEGKRTR